jgi:hypothetical protein
VKIPPDLVIFYLCLHARHGYFMKGGASLTFYPVHPVNPVKKVFLVYLNPAVEPGGVFGWGGFLALLFSRPSLRLAAVDEQGLAVHKRAFQ